TLTFTHPHTHTHTHIHTHFSQLLPPPASLHSFKGSIICEGGSYCCHFISLYTTFMSTHTQSHTHTQTQTHTHTHTHTPHPAPSGRVPCCHYLKGILPRRQPLSNLADRTIRA